MICKRTRPVLMLKERKSRFVISAKLSGKTAAETANSGDWPRISVNPSASTTAANSPAMT
jgi:hypothetical protein